MISGYIITIAVAVILTGAMEAMVPNSNIKKVYKLVCGVVMSLVIITPFFANSFDLADIFLAADEYIVPQGTSEQIEQFQKTQVDDVFAKRVEAAVKDLIKEKTGREMEVDVMAEDGTIEKVIVYGKVMDLKPEIAQMLGIEEAQIACEI